MVVYVSLCTINLVQEETFRLHSSVVDAAVVLDAGKDDSLNLIQCFLVVKEEKLKNPLLEKQLADFVLEKLALKVELIVNIISEIPKCDRGKVNRRALAQR